MRSREMPLASVRVARRVAAMDLEVSDKVAVVTGASHGIGLAVVRELAGEGALAGALSTETLDGLDRVSAYSVDLLDPDGPGRLVGQAIELHGRVDVLVNNVDGVHPQGIPTGRFSTPEEVATLVALLAAPRTAQVTGSDYVIDGVLPRPCEPFAERTSTISDAAPLPLPSNQRFVSTAADCPAGRTRKSSAPSARNRDETLRPRPDDGQSLRRGRREPVDRLLPTTPWTAHR